MGLFDQLAQAASNVAQAGQSATQGQGLMNLVGPMLDRFGGVQGLLDQLQQGGLGSAVSSWLGSGDNAAISVPQLQQALGEETMQDLAQQTGQSAQDWGQQLTQLLPGLIDKLSPNGQIDTDQASNLSSLGDLLGQFLRR